MGIVVADGAIDLAEQRHPGDARACAAQAMGDVGHFLAERRRRRRLAVRTRHHRQFGKFVRQIREAARTGPASATSFRHAPPAASGRAPGC
jgi:hypothetical protein